MSSLPLPAPIWRRLAAAAYDGLLLVAIWLAVLSIDLLVRKTFALEHNPVLLRWCLFLAGLAYFGLSWTRGGQTVGMRAWRLQLRRPDGAALRWPVAALRYGAMLLVWGMTLAPFAIAALPARAPLPHRQTALVFVGLMSVAGWCGFLLDRRRLAPQDWIAGTELVHLPK
jgi:uncharacterized RDD family membrane protein YckC